MLHLLHSMQGERPVLAEAPRILDLDRPERVFSLILPRGLPFPEMKGCSNMQVRDAGEEAWLGKEAPEDAALDVPAEPLLMLPPAPGASAKAAQKGATAQMADPNNHLSFG